MDNSRILDNLDEYFSYQINRCRVSDNSKTTIFNPSKFNICHILPKRKYKSVACHKDNVMFLTSEEHTNFDNWMDSANFDKLINNFSDEFFIKLEERLARLLEDVEEYGSHIRNYKKLIEQWRLN